jgi:hypothetical protein
MITFPILNGDTAMARPKKDKELLMDRIFRIMLSAEQEATIREAATLAGLETSTWARSELLKIAKKMLAKNDKIENGSA